MTGNVRDNCYPHIRLLPTHLHLASANFIRILPVATSPHLHIRLLPIAVHDHDLILEKNLGLLQVDFQIY